VWPRADCDRGAELTTDGALEPTDGALGGPDGALGGLLVKSAYPVADLLVDPGVLLRGGFRLAD
jgi:hypothetical protein